MSSAEFTEWVAVMLLEQNEQPERDTPPEAPADARFK